MSGKKSVFLDVDSKILEKNLLLKENSTETEDFENFFRSSHDFGKDETPWKLVTPQSGFCVKTVDEKGKKVFVNVCKVDEIPEPKEITEDELVRLWRSEEVTDYRVPLSIQDPRDELDKAGKPSTVYDVAINSKFFRKVDENAAFRSFLLQVAFEGLENKYDIELKKEGYVILKNRKCVGELRPHRIRIQKGGYKPPKRLIEELSSGSETFGSGDGSEKPVSSDSVPEHRLIRKSDILLGEFYLPNIINSDNVILEVGEDRIVLECQKTDCLLDIFVPINVNRLESRASFDKDTKILTVVMPIASTPG